MTEDEAKSRGYRSKLALNAREKIKCVHAISLKEENRFEIKSK
jgi:hypothetical protein